MNKTINTIQFMINRWDYVIGVSSGSGTISGGPEGTRWITAQSYPEDVVWGGWGCGEYKYDPETENIYRNEPEYSEKTAEGLIYNWQTNQWEIPPVIPEN